jgi:hypothetical protein
MFLEQVGERTRIFNWDSLLTVSDAKGVARSLLNSYGMLTMDECRTHATTELALQDQIR